MRKYSRKSLLSICWDFGNSCVGAVTYGACSLILILSIFQKYCVVHAYFTLHVIKINFKNYNQSCVIQILHKYGSQIWLTSSTWEKEWKEIEHMVLGFSSSCWDRSVLFILFKMFLTF